MKRRYCYILNIFSIVLLLFALYLNFIKKETIDVSPVNIITSEKGLKIQSSAKELMQPGNIIVLKSH